MIDASEIIQKEFSIKNKGIPSYHKYKLLVTQIKNRKTYGSRLLNGFKKLDIYGRKINLCFDGEEYFPFI